ncbi:polysaccharide deacetylase family protein [Actinomadura scrupuli]|uniref:polysaccharide deacetylase family protein n=1 Tax=Actinomadura scrupuli TaxID=559629 RepID=UPI003D97A4EE
MEAHDREPHAVVAREIGRREALGLSALGALGVSMVLAGDAGPAPDYRPLRTRAKGPPPPRPSVSPVTPSPARPVGATGPVPAWRKPARSVHDVRPDAPKNAVALTIDDGPHPEWTPRVLDLLAKHDVKATFCLIGEQVRDNYKLVQLMVEAGHEVANHTWRHPININKLPAGRVENEIVKARQVIVEVTGTTPRLFRAPGGNWSPTVFKAVARHGMFPIDWDIDPRDWSRPGVRHVTRELLRGKAGDILLCHDGGGDRSQTLKSLRTVLPRLKDRGLEFITL